MAKREWIKKDEDGWQSTNKLICELRQWRRTKGWPLPGQFIEFRIGTVEGLYQTTDRTYDILAIKNSQPGNGHFQDLFDFFERSCKRDNRNMRFLEVINERLQKHLVSVRGFERERQTNNFIKSCV